MYRTSDGESRCRRECRRLRWLDGPISVAESEGEVVFQQPPLYIPQSRSKLLKGNHSTSYTSNTAEDCCRPENTLVWGSCAACKSVHRAEVCLGESPKSVPANMPLVQDRDSLSK